jgi:hypothetical protein
MVPRLVCKHITQSKKKSWNYHDLNHPMGINNCSLGI